MKLEEAIKICKKLLEVKHEIYFTLTDKVAIETVLKVLENSIPKKKIEDKMKELVKEANYRTNDNPTGRIHFLKEPCDYKIQILYELLEDK